MAEVDAHSLEEHFDVLTRTGQKTGISKPRQATLSLCAFTKIQSHILLKKLANKLLLKIVMVLILYA